MIEGKTLVERIDWAISRLENLGNTIKDSTKHELVAVLNEARKHAASPLPNTSAPTLTIHELETLRSSDEISDRNRLHFVGYHFTFRRETDGREFKGIITDVICSSMNDGVTVKFEDKSGKLKNHRLFFDYLRESQGTPDFCRWFLYHYANGFDLSHRGYLTLEGKAG